MLRWVLTLDLISLIFLIFFLDVLFRLSLLRRTPVELWSIILIHVLSHWSTLFSCTLLVSSLHHLSMRRRVGAARVSVCTQLGTEPSPPSFPTLTVLVLLQVIMWRTPVTWIMWLMVNVHCVFTAFTGSPPASCHISLSSFNVKLHSLSISNTVKGLPVVILVYGSLVYRSSLRCHSC